MSHPIIFELEKEQMKNHVDSFEVGDTVRVHSKIVEGEKERIQVFEGTVLKKQNGGVRETFTVRRLSYGIGVEKTWPTHSPRVEKIEVIRKGKVRRAKLFYLRERVGKSAKVKENMMYTDRVLKGGKVVKAESTSLQEAALAKEPAKTTTDTPDNKVNESTNE